jgi:hypothetical protein
MVAPAGCLIPALKGKPKHTAKPVHEACFIAA